jgi:hypothetical protein
MTAAEGAAADAVSEWQAQTKASKGNNGSLVNPQKTVQKLQTSTLLSATTWDIFSPPPFNTFSVRQKTVASRCEEPLHRSFAHESPFFSAMENMLGKSDSKSCESLQKSSKDLD